MQETPPIRQLVWALMGTGIIFLLQLVGALMSGSLSLLSNAGHLFTDVGSMGLALYAAKIGQNRPTEQLSYGYSRSGIVAAFVNGMILAAIAIALILSGIYRLFHPSPVHVPIMLVVTAVTLVLNLAVTWMLHPPHESHDVNRWGVYWHALGDALSSVGILAAALLIHLTAWLGWDALAAIAVGVLIVVASYRVGRPSLRILMEAAPEGAQFEDIRSTFLAHPQVHDVHHLHVWSISPDYHVLSAHVRVATGSIREGQHIVEQLSLSLKEEHHIQHVTIQVESDRHSASHPDDV